MSARLLVSVGVAALVSAAPAVAQSRGTVEFGAFASNTMYDNSLGMNDNWGGGGRIGAFLSPRVALEFTVGGGNATRTLGRPDVNVTTLSAGATYSVLRLGKTFSLQVGAGGDHMNARFFDSYGFHGLVGAKLGVTDNIALRADAIQSWMNHENGTNTALRVGVSVFRRPLNRVRTVYQPVAATPVMHHDSVSASETHRLRVASASYTALRDSLAAPSVTSTTTTRNPSASADLATMQQMILFERNSAVLTPESKRILDLKLPIFTDNPEMRIMVMGFASQPGEADYNMALGLRRAEAAKVYLVSRGVASERIEIGTKGEGELLVSGPLDNDGTTAANTANRRNQFRLLVADPQLAAPRRP